MARHAIPPGGVGDVRPVQVKDRLWRVRVRWRDDVGTYHRTTVKAMSKSECADLALARIAQERERLLRQQPATDRELTLDEVAERWFASLEGTRRRASTIDQYRRTWRSALAPILGQDQINAITRARAQTVLHDELFARHPGHRTPDGTWQAGGHRLDEHGQRIPLRGDQPRNVLKLLLAFAADRGFRTDGHNPLEGTKPPEKAKPAPRALTDDEADRLIDMALHWHHTGHGASDVLWHGLVLMRYTGVRIGELLALTWHDIDLDAAVPAITVRHNLAEDGRTDGMQLGPTKSGTIHVIALHERAVDVLAERRQTSGASADGFVFATRTGCPVTHANFRRMLRDRVRGTDLEWVHPHTFRHTLGTKADRTLDLEAARDLLRHSDQAVTRRHYVQDDGIHKLDPRALFTAEQERPRQD
ncbi:tyrosine-type recombinase/integrase [Nocardioides panacisoli]|uniref:tyrosine-type recombinase/integrase n=1 Tax=Nocardioides panacisoli TaxID=627624 RepID=UPI001C638F2F|nr:site-specific integrase [Nocardioides panacisoli]QYJ03111.1 tyrosine-type recombinase/integrase [Nocardioides panacisoli]